jgi:hypothetical protein
MGNNSKKAEKGDNGVGPRVCETKKKQEPSVGKMCPVGWVMQPL